MIRRGLLAILLLASSAHGQNLPQWPDVGELIYRSRDRQFLTEGCVLAYSINEKRLLCASPRLVSISRSADSFNLGTAAPPLLDCGEPCTLRFPDDEATTASLDWIMPSQSLVGSSLLLSWRAQSADGTVVWEINSCTYRVGDLPCVPVSDSAVTLESLAAGEDRRQDVAMNPFSPGWLPNTHVILNIARRPLDDRDTLDGYADFEGLRIELTQ